MKLTNSLGVRTVVVAAGVLAVAALCRADGVDLVSPSLTLNLSEELAKADPPATPAPAAEPSAAPTRSVAYGHSGSRWWTVGTTYADNFHQAADFNLHLAFSQFIADDVEFALEAAGWYFHQPGDDTGGVSGSMLFRWHFKHADDYRWSVFADAGIGLLGAFDVVPEGGTGFDFLPRIGAGFTYALHDSVNGESTGPRIMAGVRYHHISNGRISGDSRNPARDAIAVYVALVVPF